MATKTIRHDPVDSEYEEMIMVKRIIRLRKHQNDLDITEIHLDNKEIILSNDSMNTLEARIESSYRDK